MINNLLSEVNKIYIAYGITDFRKQISSLCNIVQNEFNMNPYDKSAYIFCNKKRNIATKRSKKRKQKKLHIIVKRKAKYQD